MKIREGLPKAYNALPDGAKKMASNIYGTKISHFKKIVDGDYKDESIMYVALNAVRQAAKNFKSINDKKVSDVLNIEVENPELIKPRKHEHTT